MPHSAPVGIPLRRSRLVLATALLPLLLTGTASAATTLTATTLLIAPEYRLPGITATPPIRLAIVIDDVGYNLSRAERILALPRELTLGMLPYAPHTREIAERASLNGREIILHQPMEPLDHAGEEPGTLELGMTVERFEAAFAASLARLPEVSGVNNHTGSLLTAHREPMDWLMQDIAARGLYFLDSRTTPDSVAETTAREHAVPTIRRDVFLDHVRTEGALIRAFEQSLAIARARGYAVVIAHPHDITLDFLENVLAHLPADVTLSPLGALVRPAGVRSGVRQPPELRQRPDPDRTALARLGSPGSLSRSPDR